MQRQQNSWVEGESPNDIFYQNRRSQAPTDFFIKFSKKDTECMYIKITEQRKIKERNKGLIFH
jgi:hypothetical protein